MSYSTWSSDDEEDRRYTDLPHHLFEEMTDDEEELTELGHRFWCTLCAPIHLGHRFTCGLCAFQATTKGRQITPSGCKLPIRAYLSTKFVQIIHKNGGVMIMTISFLRMEEISLLVVYAVLDTTQSNDESFSHFAVSILHSCSLSGISAPRTRSRTMHWKAARDFERLLTRSTPCGRRPVIPEL